MDDDDSVCRESVQDIALSRITANSLTEFCKESLLMEGIVSADRVTQLAEAMLDFLLIPLTQESLNAFSKPAELRNETGMNLRGHIIDPPLGGASIEARLNVIIKSVLNNNQEPCATLLQFDTLQPYTDLNGVIGRTLWMYHRIHAGHGVPNKFLRNWYRESLKFFQITLRSES